MDYTPATIDMAATPLDPPPAKSVYTDVIEEENRHKWIESEKAGYDLGEGCIRGWVRKHWQGYLRARWVEHLQGKCFWAELDRGDFGLLQHQFQDQRAVLDPILDKLKSGEENLNILCWAAAHDFPRDTVRHILEALDINSRRLSCKFEPLV
jgi:hypothetical protein